jgi:hypothetical protein
LASSPALRPEVASVDDDHYHGVSSGPADPVPADRPVDDHHGHEHGHHHGHAHDGHAHDHGPVAHGQVRHGDDPRREFRRTGNQDAHRPVRLVPASSAAPVVVHLSPSLMRMSAGGRLLIAALFAAVVWAATLSVVG